AGGERAGVGDVDVEGAARRGVQRQYGAAARQAAAGVPPGVAERLVDTDLGIVHEGTAPEWAQRDPGERAGAAQAVVGAGQLLAHIEGEAVRGAHQATARRRGRRARGARRSGTRPPRGPTSRSAACSGSSASVWRPGPRNAQPCAVSAATTQTV